MITNFLANVVVTLTLVTNTQIIPAKLWRMAACPDKLPGCLVAHGECVDNPEAGLRQVKTECLELKTLSIGAMISVTITNRVVWRRTESQKLETVQKWVTESSYEEKDDILKPISWALGRTNVSITNNYGPLVCTNIVIK